MTKKEADAILLKAVVGEYPTTYNGTDVIQLCLDLFNDKEELEEQLKSKGEEIKRLKEYMGVNDELHIFKLALNESVKELVMKPIVKNIAKDLTLSRRIIVMLFSRWRENRNSLADRKKIYGAKPFDIPSDLVLRDYELTYKKAYKMLKEYPCKTR